MLVTQALNTVATPNGNRCAIHFLGKDLNYRDFAVRVARLSYLYQSEVGFGARVGFLTRGSPAVISSFFALTNIRGCMVPLNPDATDEELGHWMREAEVTHLAVTNDLLSRGRDLLKGERFSIPLIEIEKKQGGEYDKTFTAQPDKSPKDTDQILLIRTPGYADKPKLIGFNHNQVCASASSLKRPYKLGSTDRFLTTMHWSHPFAWVHGVLLPILNGVGCVIDHGLEGKDFLDFLISAKVTRLVDHPKFFARLLLFCKEFQSRIPGTKSITVGVGAAPQMLLKIFELMKLRPLVCYGQTENLWSIAVSDFEKEKIAPGLGRGLPGMKYKVVDDRGDTIEKQNPRIGLLAISSPSAMMGLVGPKKMREELEKKTKNSLRGTWLYTGDLAKLEDDGDEVRVTFLARKDETMLGPEGDHIIPHRVDEAVKGLAGLQEAAGFVTKNQMGKKILALAAVKIQGGQINEQDILERCKTQLPPNLVPSFVTFTDVLPKDLIGQVNRTKLSSQFSGIA